MSSQKVVGGLVQAASPPVRYLIPVDDAKRQGLQLRSIPRIGATSHTPIGPAAPRRESVRAMTRGGPGIAYGAPAAVNELRDRPRVLGETLRRRMEVPVDDDGESGAQAG
jgi:hypothetical protein